MRGDDRIGTAFERSVRALERRPGFGRGTATTRVALRQGLHCDIEDGAWKLQADLPEKAGGGGAAPDPGVLGRSALGSCLAIAYAQWAAHLDVPLDALAVEIRADYDVRGQYGVGDRRPDYRRIRYVVTIESPAPAERIAELAELAEAHCPYLQVFAREQDLEGELRHTAAGE